MNLDFDAMLILDPHPESNLALWMKEILEEQRNKVLWAIVDAILDLEHDPAYAYAEMPIDRLRRDMVEAMLDAGIERLQVTRTEGDGS